MANPMTTTLTGGHNGSVLCVDVLSDGSRIASGGEGGDLCLWLNDGTLVHRYTEEDTDCTSVLFSRQQNSKVYASFGTTICIFSMEDMTKPTDTLNFNEEEINQIVLNENEKYMAACDDSGEVKIIDLQEKKVFKTLRNKHSNICATVSFRFQKPSELFTGGLDSKLIHWDFSRLKCLNQFNMQELHNTYEDTESYMVNPPLVHHLSQSPDGKFLVAALENGLIAVYDSSRKNLREIFSLHAHSYGASQVHFLTDSKFVSGGNDCCIIVWDLNKPEEQNSGNQNGSGAVANGGTSPTEHRNENMTEICKIQTVQHSGKINWMKPFVADGNQMLAIGDESNRLTVIVL